MQLNIAPQELSFPLGITYSTQLSKTLIREVLNSNACARLMAVHNAFSQLNSSSATIAGCPEI